MSEAARDDAALDWVRRLHDPTFDEWDAHLAWLEENPANAAAFDRQALRMAALTEGLAIDPPHLAADNDNPPSAARRWVVGSLVGGLAAALVAGVVLPGTLQQRGVAIRTAPGERRIVTMADGTRIALNGDTRVSFADRDARAVSLDAGEALFSVVHDAARPFEVRVGGMTVRDVGTVFNLASDGDRVDLGVREGAIDLERGGRSVRVPAGRALTAANGEIRLSMVSPRDVGGWRDGRLTYADATVGQLVVDVRRATGVPIRVATPADQRRFTGVLMLDGDRRTLIARLAAVTGLAATHDTHGWTLRVPAR